MEEQGEKKERVKKGFWMECPLGHRWYSRGTGERAKCPICYEERTGKKLGRSPEEMAKMRELIKRKPKEEPTAGSEDTVTVPEPAQPEKEVGTWTPGGGNDDSMPQPEPKPQEKPEPRQPNALEKFLGFRIS